MKKWSILLVLIPVLNFSQEKNKLQFESVALNPLSIYLANSSGGFAFNGDVGLSYKGQQFLVSAQFGEELTIWRSSFDDSFKEVSLSWGKQFQITSWLQWDGFAGLSYFYYKAANITTRDYDRKTTVGVPLISKLKCMIGDYFSVGIQLRANVNTVQAISSGGLIFQIDF